MHIHLLSRPRRHASWMPSGTAAALATGLVGHGAHVTLDVHPTEPDVPGPARGSVEFRAAVRGCVADLRQSWQDGAPDVVHAVGYVATVAAVRVAAGSVPVVATFYQATPWSGLEQWLAARTTSLAVPSTQERDRWERLPRPPRHVAVVPPALQVEQVMRTRPDSGTPVVVTDATGPALRSLVRALPSWRGARLVVVGSASAAQIAHACEQAEDAGVLDRLEWRSDLAGVPLARQVEEADVVVAVAGARDGALVSQAAAVEVPVVAVDRDAHADLVVSGATGLLVPADGGASLGEAVRHLLADPLLRRGYGASARVRAQAIQEPGVVARRMLDVYEEALLPTAAAAPLDGRGSAGQPGDGIETTERDRLVTEHLPLARQLAQRYIGRGQPIEDLVQVASLGLVKAAQRFDPAFGTPFPSYAVPTIRGELRRHFRDHAWAVRVPRTLQETTLQVERASQEISQAQGSEASVQDVAEQLGLSDLEVAQAKQTSEEAFSRASLDTPVGTDGGTAMGDLLGEDDPSLEMVELRESVREALSRLPDREREILLLRFFGEHTQNEIAEHLGLSQVHVSRTLTRTLTALREHVLDETPLPRRWASPDVA